MRRRHRAWQQKLQAKLRQEIDFLPKRLVLFTVLLLALYAVLAIRTEFRLRTDHPGLVGARLQSELTVDYTTENQSLAFAPLRFALVEAKIRDQNPYLSEEEVAILVQAASTAAHAPIVTATPTPGTLGAVLQSVNLVTQSVGTATVPSVPVVLATTDRVTVVATVAVPIATTVPPTALPTAVVFTERSEGNPDLAAGDDIVALLVRTPSPTAGSAATVFPPAIPATVTLTPTMFSVTAETDLDADAGGTIAPEATATPPRVAMEPTPVPGMITTPLVPAPSATTLPATVSTVGASATTVPTLGATSTLVPTMQTALSKVTPTNTPTAGTSTELLASLASTATVRPSATATASRTPSPTPVIVVPATATATVAPTKTNTPLPTPLFTPSFTPTAAPTAAPTATATPMPTPTVTPTIGAPPAVTNLTAYVENEQVYLTWSPSAAAGVVGYNLYRSYAEPVEAGVLVNSQPIEDVSYTDMVAMDGSQPLYVVVAVNQFSLISPPSQAVAVKLPDHMPPQTPNNFSVRLSGTTVQLQWQASVDPDLAGYNVYRSTQLPIDRSQGPLNGATPLPVPSYQDTIALNGEVYYYVFTAIDQSGNESLPTIEAQVPTIDFTAPASPTGVAVILQEDAALIQWQANTESDLAGYRLYRSHKLPVEQGAPLHTQPLLTTTEYRDNDLHQGETYHYLLVAVDRHQNVSMPSGPVTLVVPE